MRQSEHFNLFLAEGSDIVNPLVQDVQNYEDIDAQMFKNQNAGVQNATELKTGTVHAITRNVPDAQFITFTATSNYTAGETFTVDGVQVTALTVGGEALPTGAYVINSQVLCVLKGTLLTVYGVGSEVADNSLALNGHPDTYFGTKEDVDNAINTANAANELVNEVNNSLGELFKNETVEVFAEGLTYPKSQTALKSYEPPIGYKVFGIELVASEASITVSGLYYEEANKMIVLKYGCWYTGGSVGHNVLVRVLLVKKQ